MVLESLAALVLFGGLAGYAIFGGADFGGGFWTALPVGAHRQRQREAIFQAIGPVWETNHVWLILVLVTLWTAFPIVFSALFENLFIPLSLALIGIVARGAAFAFRHFDSEDSGGLPATGLVFSVASIVTPFAMGVCIGAVTGGHLDVASVPPDAYRSWLQPFPVYCGLIAVGVCAFLVPFYMLARPLAELRADFRRDAIFASLGLGGLTALALPIAAWDAPAFWQQLQHPLPVVAVLAAVLAGIVSLVVALRGLDRWAPVAAAAAVVLILTGWAVAMRPYMILPDTTIMAAVAPRGTLLAFLSAMPIGVAVLAPSLVVLFRLFATMPPAEL